MSLCCLYVSDDEGDEDGDYMTNVPSANLIDYDSQQLNSGRYATDAENRLKLDLKQLKANYDAERRQLELRLKTLQEQTDLNRKTQHLGEDKSLKARAGRLGKSIKSAVVGREAKDPTHWSQTGEYPTPA